LDNRQIATDRFTPPGVLLPTYYCTCDLCGTIHFSARIHAFIDESALEEFRTMEWSNPYHYLQHPTGSIVLKVRLPDGRNGVVGCPCNGLKMPEEQLLKMTY
jgi:hypothetical protein